MSLFEVDQKKCARDGICAAVCPIGIIEFRDRTPVPTADAETRCISCGHCVAVCPAAALSHCRMTPGDCQSLEAGWRLDPASIERAGAAIDGATALLITAGAGYFQDRQR